MNTISDNIPVTRNLERIANRKLQFFEEDLRRIKYAGETCVKIEADTYPLAPDAWHTLCNYLVLPETLLPQLKQHLGNLVLRSLHSVGRRAPNAPEHLRLYYTEQNQIMAINNAKLACLSNEEVVHVVQEALPSNILSQTLSARCFLTDTEFELDCFTKTLVTEPQPEDILYGGIQVRHSQAGLFPTVVLAYVHRLVCSNGMTQRVCLGGKPARVKRCKSSGSKEIMVESIQQQLKGAVEQVGERLHGITELTKHKLDINELPENLRRRWSINKEVAEEIRNALQQDELDRTYTEYDLVNALSRVATHSTNLAPRYRRHLSLAAGMFAQRHVHCCPACGNWVVEG